MWHRRYITRYKKYLMLLTCVEVHSSVPEFNVSVKSDFVQKVSRRVLPERFDARDRVGEFDQGHLG